MSRAVMLNEDLKRSAYTAVAKARRRGELPAQPCEIGSCQRRPTVAHHEDYAKPLDVVWLCRLHHTWRHMGEVTPT